MQGSALQSDVASAVLGHGGQPGGHRTGKAGTGAVTRGVRGLRTQHQKDEVTQQEGRAPENESKRPAVWGLADLENGDFP